MRFQILEFREVGMEEFIQFWSRRYSDRNECLYSKNIGKRLTEQRIWDLFEWKNGRKLSIKKQRQSIQANFIGSDQVRPDADKPSEVRDFLIQPGAITESCVLA